MRDVTAYLRLIRNRYDDAAFLAVIASPLVGVTQRQLARLRTSAPKRPLYTSVENGIPATVDADDGRRLAAFRQRFDRLVDAAGRSSLGRAGRAHRRRPRLRPGAARATPTARAGWPTCASWRDWRVSSRPSAAPTWRASSRPSRCAGWRPTASPTRWCRRDADAVRLMTVHAAKGLAVPRRRGGRRRPRCRRAIRPPGGAAGRPRRHQGARRGRPAARDAAPSPRRAASTRWPRTPSAAASRTSRSRARSSG